MNNEDAIRILLNSNEYHHARGDLPHSAASIEAFNKAIDALKAERPRCANCEHYKPDGTPNVYESCVCIHPAEEYPLDSVLRMKPDDFCSRFEERSK